jgi:poly(beta-D-mannuronate) C5 epimerase
MGRLLPDLAGGVARMKFSSRRGAMPWLAAAVVLAGAPQAFAATYRYSATSNRIYIENGGFASLSDVKAALPAAPLDLIDATAKVWLLRADLQISGGAELDLHGSSAGGDVNELRLQSDAGGTVISITADYGNIHMNGTRVTSWDVTAGQPDRNPADGRAFVRARSSLDVDGVTPLESRMDVLNSEVSFLGSNLSEGYGLSWKAVVADPAQLATVHVRGDVIGSHIHDLYYGVYTFGLASGKWQNNEVDHNAGYGLDAHDDSDNLLIENNNVHDNGTHGIILSERCDHAVIRNNHSTANGSNGIMLHRLSDDALVEGNEASNNGDAGLAVFASMRNTLRSNTVLGNALAGVRLSDGAADNVVSANEIGNTGQFGVYIYQGTDDPNPGDDGIPKRNTFADNQIHHSTGNAVKISQGDQNTFSGNTFTANGDDVFVQNAPMTTFIDNDLPDDMSVDLSGAVDAPVVGEFRMAPRVRVQLNSSSTARFLDDAGAVFDMSIDVFTDIAGRASTLELTTDKVGGGATVYRRSMFVDAGATVAHVAPTVWNTGGDYQKNWVAKVDDGAALIGYKIGDLHVGTLYEAHRGTDLVATVTADASGNIAFTDTPGSTLTQNYTVTPSANQPPPPPPPDSGSSGGGGGSADALLLAGLLAAWFGPTLLIGKRRGPFIRRRKNRRA